MSVILLALLVSVALGAANYTIVLSYPAGSSCNGAINGFVATNISQGGQCFPTGCTCTNNGCSQINCGPDLPGDPSNAIVTASYPTTGCNGQPSFYAAATSGVCANTTTGGTLSSQQISCGGGNFVTKQWSTVGDCSGAASTTTSIPFSGSACIDTGNGQSQFVKCGSVCFHKDTKVGYEGKTMTLKDIPQSQDCTIPHHVVSDGVKVTTTCPGVLRLTHQHLVRTPAGWQAAGSLKKGDSLFSKVGAETADCEIISIETERKQEYFGLNCLNSEVLADGYWVSTFGNKHALPAAWMKYGGSVLGIQRASAWGDSVVSFLEDWNLLSRD